MNEMDDVSWNGFFYKSTYVTTRGHDRKLTKTPFRLDLHKPFFSQRIIDYWNGLPTTAIHARRQCQSVQLDILCDMEKHSIKMCTNANFFIYRVGPIQKIRRFLTTESCKILMHSLVTSRLDYQTACYATHRIG